MELMGGLAFFESSKNGYKKPPIYPMGCNGNPSSQISDIKITTTTPLEN